MHFSENQNLTPMTPNDPRFTFDPKKDSGSQAYAYVWVTWIYFDKELMHFKWKSKFGHCDPKWPQVNPKRAGLFGPISQPGGRIPPPKILETDWRNIKCVVLVDSYDLPESIDTFKKYKHTLYDVTVTS